MTLGTSKAAKEPVVDIQASSAQQDVQAAPSLPLFDLSDFLLARDGPSAEQNAFCEEVASCLQQTGCLIVRDPRVSSEQSDCFLDMMERYFSQPTELKMPDVHPELHYQVCLIGKDLAQLCHFGGVCLTLETHFIVQTATKMRGERCGGQEE